MTKTRLKTNLTRLHFLFLAIGIFNWLSQQLSGISLNREVAYGLSVLVFISGLILFFWNLKPFKLIQIYYSYYFLTPLLTLFLWLFGGLFLALMSSVLLYPIYPNEKIFEDEHFTVYHQFQGFMGDCCPMTITQKQYWLMEEKLTEVDFYANTAIHAVGFSESNDRELIIEYDRYDYHTNNFIPADTIVKLKQE